jgi:hypothetical protein
MRASSTVFSGMPTGASLYPFSTLHPAQHGHELTDPDLSDCLVPLPLVPDFSQPRLEPTASSSSQKIKHSSSLATRRPQVHGMVSLTVRLHHACLTSYLTADFLPPSLAQTGGVTCVTNSSDLFFHRCLQAGCTDQAVFYAQCRSGAHRWVARLRRVSTSTVRRLPSPSPSSRIEKSE